jgi:2',3'-cyclic-nucleotide 2'-phosphodiesterase (5'-nucleotidase family)
VIERGGIRFGLFGLLGKEAQFYTTGAGAVTFSDAVEAAKEMVRVLRETEKVDVVICLSHGGLEKGNDGRFNDGDDVRLPRAVPGIDVVIGGHSHTALQETIIVNDRTPVVQTGLEGRNLGELVLTRRGGRVATVFPRSDRMSMSMATSMRAGALRPTRRFARRHSGPQSPAGRRRCCAPKASFSCRMSRLAGMCSSLSAGAGV